MVQRVFFGSPEKEWHLPDLSLREGVMMAAMVLVIVWLGLYPQPVLNTAQPVLDTLTSEQPAAAALDYSNSPSPAVDPTTLLLINTSNSNQDGGIVFIPPPSAFIPIFSLLSQSQIVCDKKVNRRRDISHKN